MRRISSIGIVSLPSCLYNGSHIPEKVEKVVFILRRGQASALCYIHYTKPKWNMMSQRTFYLTKIFLLIYAINWGLPLIFGILPFESYDTWSIVFLCMHKVSPVYLLFDIWMLLPLMSNVYFFITLTYSYPREFILNMCIPMRMFLTIQIYWLTNSNIDSTFVYVQW